MSLRERWFAAGYDRMIAGPEKAGLRAQREVLIARASGPQGAAIRPVRDPRNGRAA